MNYLNQWTTAMRLGRAGDDLLSERIPDSSGWHGILNGILNLTESSVETDCAAGRSHDGHARMRVPRHRPGGQNPPGRTLRSGSGPLSFASKVMPPPGPSRTHWEGACKSGCSTACLYKRLTKPLKYTL